MSDKKWEDKPWCRRFHVGNQYTWVYDVAVWDNGMTISGLLSENFGKLLKPMQDKYGPYRLEKKTYNQVLTYAWQQDMIKLQKNGGQVEVPSLVGESSLRG